MITTASKLTTPVLKWAGGKRKLLPRLQQYFPAELTSGQIRYYAEPFVGGGAMFFHIAQHYQLEHYYLFDINPAVIACYQVLQVAPRALIDALQTLSDGYLTLEQQQRQQYFYAVRERYNATSLKPGCKPRGSDLITHAAMTIFLNRTCFNGLYRVNRQGEFNVPHGRYRAPLIVNADNLWAAHELLQRATIKCIDFMAVTELANSSMMIYYDPPYRPISKTACFNQYAQNGFGDTEQQRLQQCFSWANQHGAKQLLSNSASEDGFFQQLYRNFTIHTIQAARHINADASKRGLINELVITNYSAKPLKLI